MASDAPVPGRGWVPSGVEVAVVASGVASMGLEILAGRLVAPAFGSSIYVWGSIIGVFLAALTVGYWIAGRRAGQHASRTGLAAALVFAAAYVALLVLIADPLIDASTDLDLLPYRYAPLVPITALFGPPTVLLGFVSPYGAELVEADSVGDASGRVYALGTAGSIVGAFGTTFLLIPELPVLWIEVAFGLVLIGAAAAVAPRSPGPIWPVIPIVGVLLLGAAAVAGGVGVAGGVVHEEQTAENQHLRIVDEDGVRTMYLGGTPQSAMDLDDPGRYVFDYSSYVHLPLLFRDEPPDTLDRVLFVGGGGFSSPKRYLQEYPNVTVDVVEIDPGVIAAAKQYFRVEESERLRIHNEDGRRFLRETDHTYDVIVLDAYRSSRVPFHLTTVEFMQLANRHLADDGVLFANLISSTDGPDSRFYRAEYRTMARAFPQVYSFPTRDTSGLQNIELLATVDDRRIDSETLRARNQNWDVGLDLADEIDRLRSDVGVGDAPLLTDDYAPVDDLLASQVAMEYTPNRTEGTAEAAG